MKKFALMSLITCASAFAAATNFPIYSKPKDNCSQDLRVVHLSQVQDEDLDEMMQGKHPEMAVEFPAQTTLPIHFFLTGDLVNLMENSENFCAVEIKQTVYIRCNSNEMLFSTNLTDWKPFMEFITGNASISLTMKEGRPSLVVGAKTFKRS